MSNILYVYFIHLATVLMGQICRECKFTLWLSKKAYESVYGKQENDSGKTDPEG